MSNPDQHVSESKGFNRRTVVKGAAWSVPVIAMAVAAPTASASVLNATLSLPTPSTSLLTLNLLDGGGTVTAGALVTVPTIVRLANGDGAITGQVATVKVTVARPTGITVTLGRARGFGVYSYNGVNSTSTERTAVYQSSLGVPYGFPMTTFTTTQIITVASNGVLDIPVVWGLAGVSTGVAVNALTNFLVSVEVTVGGRTLAAADSISLLANAGIL